MKLLEENFWKRENSQEANKPLLECFYLQYKMQLSCKKINYK